MSTADDQVSDSAEKSDILRENADISAVTENVQYLTNLPTITVSESTDIDIQAGGDCITQKTSPATVSHTPKDVSTEIIPQTSTFITKTPKIDAGDNLEDSKSYLEPIEISTNLDFLQEIGGVSSNISTPGGTDYSSEDLVLRYEDDEPDEINDDNIDQEIEKLLDPIKSSIDLTNFDKTIIEPIESSKSTIADQNLEDSLLSESHDDIANKAVTEIIQDKDLESNTLQLDLTEATNFNESKDNTVINKDDKVVQTRDKNKIINRQLDDLIDTKPTSDSEDVNIVNDGKEQLTLNEQSITQIDKDIEDQLLSYSNDILDKSFSENDEGNILKEVEIQKDDIIDDKMEEELLLEADDNITTQASDMDELKHHDIVDKSKDLPKDMEHQRLSETSTQEISSDQHTSHTENQSPFSKNDEGNILKEVESQKDDIIDDKMEKELLSDADDNITTQASDMDELKHHDIVDISKDLPKDMEHQLLSETSTQEISSDQHTSHTENQSHLEKPDVQHEIESTNAHIDDIEMTELHVKTTDPFSEHDQNRKGHTLLDVDFSSDMGVGISKGTIQFSAETIPNIAKDTEEDTHVEESQSDKQTSDVLKSSLTTVIATENSDKIGVPNVTIDANISLDLNTSQESIVKKDHGLKGKKDMMIEIPTQELIDLDESNMTDNFEDSSVNISNIDEVFDNKMHDKLNIMSGAESQLPSKENPVDIESNFELRQPIHQTSSPIKVNSSEKSDISTHDTKKDIVSTIDSTVGHPTLKEGISSTVVDIVFSVDSTDGDPTLKEGISSPVVRESATEASLDKDVSLTEENISKEISSPIKELSLNEASSSIVESSKQSDELSEVSSTNQSSLTKEVLPQSEASSSLKATESLPPNTIDFNSNDNQNGEEHSSLDIDTPNDVNVDMPKGNIESAETIPDISSSKQPIMAPSDEGAGNNLELLAESSGVMEEPSTSSDLPSDQVLSTSNLPSDQVPSTSDLPSIQVPSTSTDIPLSSNQPFMASDSSDEVPENDSLGLLAESSRVMEDDEEQETSEQDADDDDDSEGDDESNQMIECEDSNAPPSESELLETQVDDKNDDNKIDDDKIDDEKIDGEKIDDEIVDDIVDDKIGDDDNNDDIDIEFSLQADSDGSEGESNSEMPALVAIAQILEKDSSSKEDGELFSICSVDGALEENAQSGGLGEASETEIPTANQDAKIAEESDPKETDKPVDAEKCLDANTESDSILKKALEAAAPKCTKMKNLEIAHPKHVENFVDLEESSSEDETKTSKTADDKTKSVKMDVESGKSDVDLTTDIDLTESVEIDADANIINADDSVKDTDANIIDAGANTTDAGANVIDADAKILDSDAKVAIADPNITNADTNITDTDENILIESDGDANTSDDKVTSVNLPSDIDIMSSGINISQITTKQGEIVISGVPRAPPQKKARLNTSEVTIKTVVSNDVTVSLKKIVSDDSPAEEKGSQAKEANEVFSLDSDDEDTLSGKATSLQVSPEKKNRCINNHCPSDGKIPFIRADMSTRRFYESKKKRKNAMVCQHCAFEAAMRQKNLVASIKDFTPLLALDIGRVNTDTVEISDSDSDDEQNSPAGTDEIIGVEGARMLEDKLVTMLNETWEKYRMDERLKETEDEIHAFIKTFERESKEIDDILNDCQVATDKVRTDLYAAFPQRRKELEPIAIFSTPDLQYSCYEEVEKVRMQETAKRRHSSGGEIPAKRPAIPLGYDVLDDKPSTENVQEDKPKPVMTAPPPADPKVDDDKDVSVVQLSAESAPAELPPPGEVVRPPLRAGLPVLAMRNAFGSWLKARIVEITGKGPAPSNFTECKVRFETSTKNPYKSLMGRCLAYAEPATVRMKIGTRLIALFIDKENASKRGSFYSGVVAEEPTPVNKYRYLVFFDHGNAQYVHHKDTRLVCEYSSLVWEEVHPFSRQFVKEYLQAYPERPMVRLHKGQSIKTEWNGKWWACRVEEVDASLVQVLFESDNRREWIYRGSTRLAPLFLELQAAERHRARPRNRLHNKPNMPYVEYTRSDEQVLKAKAEADLKAQQEELRRQRAVAKKSTAQANQHPTVQPNSGNLDSVTSRVVYYTPKNAIRPHKMVTHNCGPRCKRTDVLALKDLRTYNPLAKPLLSGWERQLVRVRGHKEVLYRAPCGRRLRNMPELHTYLRLIQSDMGVDLFDFTPNTHCLAEFVLNKCIVGKKDLSHGKENVPVPCVNYYDDSLPEMCAYNTERTPTAGVPLNLDPDFLCGCDCTDDCEDKSKCACWKMTLEGAKTIGLEGESVGYEYKRLPDPLPSGIYECNSRCKCKSTCLNRVAQHPLQLKLQVFKTLNRGWGIRALNDVPKGSFLCVYAGNLLTDATANLDGLNEGDEYLAELDYIEVVEQMKEGYEEDIPDADKEDKDKDSSKEESSSEEKSSSEDEEKSKEGRDRDFVPQYMAMGLTKFSKHLRKRKKKQMEEDSKETKDKEKEKKEKEGNKGSNEEDCITISDDEEVREPARFDAQKGIKQEIVSKHRSVRSFFGEDEACYIMDAKVQGNIGRYLNHSCCPNVFVQNVFVDTHDPRFPWVAFFALSHIRAGTELTWNYNYDIGSVPGKVLYCFCGAANCRGRLL